MSIKDMEVIMSKVDYRLEDRVAVVTLNNGENRFNPDFINEYIDVLDQIENKTDALTLVVLSGHEKILSNGIDLDWLLPFIQNKDVDVTKSFFYQLNRLFRKTLTYPLITIAAVNGHAFAGGAIWSCAFDFRFMRSDRGFFCFPEADLGIPFLPGMIKLLRKAIPNHMMEEMVYTGIRLTAEQCVEHHIVKQTWHNDQLLENTLSFAKKLNKNRAYIKEMRHRMYKDILHALDVEDIMYIESERFIVTSGA